MNLVNILKVDQIVYCPLADYGRVVSIDYDEDVEYPIVVCFSLGGDIENMVFTSDGRYFSEAGDCLLWPSKDNRDWSSYVNDFQPFEKVLVRDNDEEPWKAAFYDYRDDHEADYPYYTIGGTSYSQCIRFEGNEEKNGRLN